VTKVLLLLVFLASYSTSVAQNSSFLDELRQNFQKINSEDDIEQIMGMSIDSNEPEASTAKAYQAASTCMMAEYAFSPVKKIKYFNQGKTSLDELIAEDKSVENVYLRLLVQLNSPRLLNYYQNIDEDIAFLEAELPEAKIDVDYKYIMIRNLVTLADKNELKEVLLGIDVTSIEKKL